MGTSIRPLVQEWTQPLCRHEFGKFFADVRGNVDHTTYDNAEFSDGSVVSQEDRDNTFASIALRGGFEMSPAIKPFVEVELGKLMYDESLDANGFRRSGPRIGLRGGVELDIAEKLKGELAIGYLRQVIDDPRLAPSTAQGRRRDHMVAATWHRCESWPVDPCRRRDGPR